MKKVIRVLSAHLLLSLYVLAAVLTAASCLGTAAWDAAGYAAGRLYEQEIPATQLTMENILITEQGVWASTTADPQLSIMVAQQVRTVEITAEFAPSDAEAYYGRGADFGLRRRVWAKDLGRTAEGHSTMRFDLPLSGGNAVRVDPAGDAGRVVTVYSMKINVKRPLASYFQLRPQQVFWLVILPAAVAALVDWGRSVWRAAGGRTGKQEEKA